MLFRGVEVDEINLLVFLKDECANWKDKEYKVLQWLKDNNIKAGVENPIDDLVYIYLPYDEKTSVARLSEIYQKAKNRFKEVKISLHLSKFIEGCNEYDLTLDEFLKLQSK